METTTNTTARVYVGTYHKYNSGSLAGAWIDLEGHDYNSFLEAARAIHSDESDPELMFQDFEGFPRKYYGESDLSEAFAYLEQVAELSDDQREAFDIWCEDGNDPDIDGFFDAYVGYYDGHNVAEDLGYQTAEECGYLEQMPEAIRCYFDAEAFGRDLLINDYWERDGYVFRRI